jgi:hypothetical protein
MIDADHWVWSTKRVPEVTENEGDMTNPTKFCRDALSSPAILPFSHRITHTITDPQR